MWRLGSHFSDVPPRVLPKIHSTILPPEKLDFVYFLPFSFIITDACVAAAFEHQFVRNLTPFSGGNIEDF
jgi:hypothetical protein